MTWPSPGLTRGTPLRRPIRAIATIATTSALLGVAQPAQAIDNTNKCTTLPYQITGTADIKVTACVAFSNNGANVQYKASATQWQHPGQPYSPDQFSWFVVLGQLRYNGSNLRTSCITDNKASDANRTWEVSCEGAWPRGTVVNWTAWAAVRYTDSTGTHYGDVDGHVAVSPVLPG
jgi:hypothetical protein